MNKVQKCPTKITRIEIGPAAKVVGGSKPTHLRKIFVADNQLLIMRNNAA